MSVAHTFDDVYYPESDGQPMGETDVHGYWSIRLLDMLKYRYRTERVYVAGNLLVYYDEGNPVQVVCPDVFVVKDCDPSMRRVYKIWKEGKSPDVAFEFTSLSSRRGDQVVKKKLYAQLGVKEYFLYDPTADYLKPRLQGFRLMGPAFQPIVPDRSDWLNCEALGIHLYLRDGELVLADVQTGQELETEGQAERTLRLNEAAERQREAAARSAAEAALRAEKKARTEEAAARKEEAAARKAAEAARDVAEARAAALQVELSRLRDARN